MTFFRQNWFFLTAVLLAGIAWGDMRSTLGRVVQDVGVIKSRMGLADVTHSSYAPPAAWRVESEAGREKVDTGAGGDRHSGTVQTGQGTLEQMELSGRTRPPFASVVDGTGGNIRAAAVLCRGSPLDWLQWPVRGKSCPCGSYAGSDVSVQGRAKISIHDPAF